MKSYELRSAIMDAEAAESLGFMREAVVLVDGEYHPVNAVNIAGDKVVLVTSDRPSK